MRTKALLSVAAIAASAISAMAQGNVYSLNIVGYATVTIPTGYSLLANPLSTGTNGANEIMPIIDGELILTWDSVGKKFVQVGYDAGNGGWVQADDSTPANPPSLPPGKGFFFFNPVAATNFTFVGQVVPNPGGTANANTIALAPGYSLVGSALPATLTTAQGGITNSPISLPAIDGMLVLSWNSAPSAQGGQKYVQTGYDLGNGGWVQADDATPSVVPPYTIGEGFFFFNPLGTAQNWVQSLP